MAEKKIQPKRPTSDEPAAGTRKAEKTSAKRVHAKRVHAQARARQAGPRKARPRQEGLIFDPTVTPKPGLSARASCCAGVAGE